MLARMWRKGKSFTMLVGIQIGAATVKNSMQVSQKTKIALPYDPAIPFLGIYLKEMKTLT